MSMVNQTASFKSLRLFFSQDLSTKLGYLILGGLSLGLLLGLLLNLINSTKVYRLKLAAGDKNGESYILSQAIEKVVEAHHPKIQIELVETGGTATNLKQLEAGEVQLATAQADVPAGPKARTVAVLYQDLFQLVVQGDAGIENFSDLRGKAIGLQPGGGQYQSFLKIAAHYGLLSTDFTFLGDSDESADVAFQQKQVAAVFRVRAAGNRSVAELVQQYQGRLIPIEQANAMRIKFPAFQSAQIPQGAYRGNPPVPAADLNTVGVDRLLLASVQVPDAVIREITTVLNERRQEIADQITTAATVEPLVANIADPRQSQETKVPIHSGALAYYERDKPSFVQENADFLALLLTIGLLGGSWFWELKKWIERRKKDLADDYITQVIRLMEHSKPPEAKQQALDQLFQAAAKGLVDEQISQESFRTFNEAYKTTREAIEREKQRNLQTQREISAKYIKNLIRLMQDEQRSKQIVQQELDQILEQASADLVKDKISEESFRTFVEAYKTTRDLLERRTA
jgi:TRAP transporter TAXI family solute receptor